MEVVGDEGGQELKPGDDLGPAKKITTYASSSASNRSRGLNTQ